MGRTHLRALTGSTSVTVAAVAEPAGAARAAVAAPGRATFETVPDLLRAGGIDGVLIAAPTDQHLEIVSLAAAAGLPILCEKPGGIDSREVGLVREVVARRGVPLQVAYWRRYVPELQALRARIHAGELGIIHLYASFQWDSQPPAITFRTHSGGIFRDMGVHEFDQVRWLSGQEFEDVWAVAAPRSDDPAIGNDPDSAQAIARLSGGSSAFVSLGRYFPGGDMARVEVFGEHDAVRSDFLDPKDGEQAQLDALVRQADGFVRFASGGPPSGASADDAVAAIEAAERAWAAIQPLRGRPAMQTAGGPR